MCRPVAMSLLLVCWVSFGAGGGSGTTLYSYVSLRVARSLLLLRGASFDTFFLFLLSSLRTSTSPTSPWRLSKKRSRQALKSPHIGLVCPYSRSLLTLVWSAQAGNSSFQDGLTREKIWDIGRHVCMCARMCLRLSGCVRGFSLPSVFASVCLSVCLSVCV